MPAIDVLFDKAFRRSASDDASFWRGVLRGKIDRFVADGVSDWDSRNSRVYYELLLGDVCRLLGLADLTGLRVLEAGSGTGMLTLLMAARGAEATLVDVLDEALEYSSMLESRIRRDGPFHGSVTRVRSDVLELSEEAALHGRFDLVHNAGVVEECAPEQAVALVRAMAALSRDRVVVAVPNFFNPYLLQLWRRYGKTSERYFSRSALRRLVAAAGVCDVDVVTTSCVHPRQGHGAAARALGVRGLGFLHMAVGRVRPA